MGTLTLQVVPRNLDVRDALREALARQDLEKDPDNWLHHDNLATLMQDAGRNEEAVQHYREVLRLNPSRTRAYINLGTIFHSVGDFGEAERLFNRALALNPGSAEAQLGLGRALYATGEHRGGGGALPGVHRAASGIRGGARQPGRVVSRVRPA